MKNIENRNGLMEVYRTSFKNFTLAAAQLQELPATDAIAREMALAEVEKARHAYSRSRDALAMLLAGPAGQDVQTCRCEAVGCC